MEPLNVLIIEDEKPAAEKLERLLKKYQPAINISGPIVSVEGAVAVLTEKADNFDLVFLDIRLIDGESFTIFKQVEVNLPVIFTTAYNQYAIEAFKLNSIHYLLKPYSFDDLKQALDKFYKVSHVKKSAPAPPQVDMELLQQLIQSPEKKYKSRFMVRKGEKIKTLDTNQIKAFYADDRDVFLLSDDNRRFSVQQKMEELEQVLNPKQFFRVNRTYIVQVNAINEIIAYSNSRLKIDVGFSFDKEIIVSREKVPSFKKWMEGE